MSATENPLRAEKRKKLEALKALGVDPYPHNFQRSATTEVIRTDFAELPVQGNAKDRGSFRLAGRLMTVRAMGKASFFNIQDQQGSIQVYIRSQELDAESQAVFNHMDLGDFLGVEGFVFRTKVGELSIHCERLFMLCKTIEPLPEKFHGITDVEIKYRHRHMDLAMSPESRKVFETRSKIIREIRRFLDDRGFLEVETPVLQPIYGGAAAQPFKTHHNALDMELFLKISPELYLKRLIIGGFEKVYDMNKNFRNEGIDRSHNPEFTMIEWYEAYTDYHDQMKQFEELVATVAERVTGSSKVTYQGRSVDFTAPWKKLTMKEAILEYGKINIDDLDDGALWSAIKKLGSDHKAAPSRGEMIAELFELTCEEHLWDPIFIMDHPVEISPLTKNHRTHDGLVERWEPFAAKMEIGNAYTELNDPVEQRKRLEDQESKRVVDDEAQPMDEDFLQAIEFGMPPTGGVGLGVERLVMLLTDCPSIRDIILFPTMKHQK